MGKKDLIEKKLEDYNDVFADIFNTLLFGGEKLRPEFLSDGATVSVYKDADDILWEQGRDVIKEYQDNTQLVITSLGIENQTKYDPVMPVRVMGYDYGSYRQQLDQKKPLHPVVTLVLNFSDERWENNRSLHQALQVSKEWEIYVQDYKIHIVDVAFLEDEIIDKFQSDFKQVARFFKDRRLGRDSFKGNETVLTYAEEFLDFLFIFTKEQTYKNNILKVRSAVEKGEKIKMCWVAQSHLEEGRQIGLKEGRIAGEKEGRLAGREEEAILTARMMFRNGLSMEIVAACVQRLSVEKLQEIYRQEQ